MLFRVGLDFKSIERKMLCEGVVLPSMVTGEMVPKFRMGGHKMTAGNQPLK